MGILAEIREKQRQKKIAEEDKKEVAIALYKLYITETKQSILNHKEVIKGLGKRIEMFENRIAKWEKDIK